jgi:hypothetical protein
MSAFKAHTVHQTTAPHCRLHQGQWKNGRQEGKLSITCFSFCAYCSRFAVPQLPCVRSGAVGRLEPTPKERLQAGKGCAPASLETISDREKRLIHLSLVLPSYAATRDSHQARRASE